MRRLSKLDVALPPNTFREFEAGPCFFGLDP